MRKRLHEIRDPVHTFIKLSDQERDLLDTAPIQRLRHIRQLGMSHYIYPGANHTRFEHSLGVMELAGRVYDTLVHPDHLTDDIRESFPQLRKCDKRSYWRRVLRAAALCHDLGHLPFSHASEDLLPEGTSHEHLTKNIILGELADVLQEMEPKLSPEDVARVAVGPKVYRETEFRPWDVLMSEIITSDTFGVDRMDYLLRDSYHVGVPNGRFDYERLIDTMRILPPPPERERDSSQDPTIGVEEGGLHSAEALLVARFFMYAQVYFHPIRRVYDIHLRDFLKHWLPNGRYSVDECSGVRMTDDEVCVALLENASASKADLGEYAARIVERQHFKLIFRPDPSNKLPVREQSVRVFQGLADIHGEQSVRREHIPPKDQELDFPVRREPSGDVASALGLSNLMEQIPPNGVDFVYVAPEHAKDARKWLDNNMDDVLNKAKGE